MALILRSLFGLTCNGEPLPGLTDADIALAIEGAPPLKEATMRAQKLDAVVGPAPTQNPSPEPEPDPNPVPAPRFNR